MRAVLVVVSNAFAGTERYVVNLAGELSERGHEVGVVAGIPLRGHLPAAVHWVPGATKGQAVRSLVRIGRPDVINAHLTWAEAAAVVTSPLHGAPVVATRHLLTPRGRS